MSTSNLLIVLVMATAPLPEPKPANELYGDAVVAILNGATRVEILRLQPRAVIRRPVETHMEGYRIVATVEQGRNQAEAVAKVIVEDAQKPFAEGENFFEPVIGYRLWKDKESVVVLMDLSNRNMQVIGHDADGKVTKRSFAVARPVTFNALLKRAQDAFPDDAGLHNFKPAEDK